MSLPKNILVPTDFSESADSALEFALDMADKLGGKVTVMHAYEIPVVGFPEGALVATAEIGERIVTGAQAGLDALVSRYEGRPIEAKPLLKCGDPREMVHATAEEIGADLIVMGTHGRRGLSRALLGSVAEYIVRTSTRPVLTVRQPTKKK